MLIDWFTVGAQTVNFLILVWLLKHFLYKPILDAISTRETRIATELADADAKRSEAEKERSEFENKNKMFDQQKSARITKSVEEVNAERGRLLDQVKKDVSTIRVNQEGVLHDDQTRLKKEITLMAQAEVFEATRKTLADLSTVSLEERVGEVFIRRLRELDSKAKGLLGASLQNSSDSALVNSAFELPEEQKTAIQNALNETFSTVVRIRFGQLQETICGIELTTGSQKLSWNIASYLSELEKKISSIGNVKPDVPTKPGSEFSTEKVPETGAATLAEAK